MYRKLLTVTTLFTLAACQDSSSPVEPARLMGDQGVDQAQLVEELPQIPVNAAAGQTVPDQYVVVLNGTVTDVPATARRLAREHGARLGYVYEAALKGFSVRMPAAAAARLGRDAAVASVEPDRVVTTDQTQAGATWGLDRIDQSSLPLSSTFTFTNTGAGVRIYILDTGVRITHQEFQARLFSRASYGWDFVNNDPIADDCNGHGTHVAGTAAGRVYGVAKAARIISVRVLNCAGQGTWAQVIAGVNWVTAHAIKPAVANMSLGGGFFSSANGAVQNSIAHGISYAIAAGNNATNTCATSPASVPEALSVMASAINDVRASFSNFGTCADLYAPGLNIKSAWYTSDVATNTISGTSMASPHVAGVAAQYLQIVPSALPVFVSATILNMATANKILGNPASTPNRLLRTTL